MKNEYVGFIKGFNAKNIASLQDTLEFKLEEVKELMQDISAQNANENVSKSVNRVLKALNTITSDDLVNKSFTAGELLKSSLTILKNADESKTRQIVLSFGQIAKLTDDKKLKEQAVELGNQFLG